jgi:malate dehydrogenase (oxaloacetate-decarboxylating)
VEVVPTALTSAEALAATVALLESMGKFPTRCSNVPGFVANRIQFAMLAEAMRIIDEGAATAEEVDRIVKSSIGFRLACFGPCEIADQAGLDVYKSIFESLRAATGREAFDTPPVIAKLNAEGRLGLKAGAGFYGYGSGGAAEVLARRDRLLAERLALFERDNRPAGAAAGAAAAPASPAAASPAAASPAAAAPPAAAPPAATASELAGPGPDVYARALRLHSAAKGKLGCASKIAVESMEDLSLVYTPGVAEACREIGRRPEAAYELTNKWNTVAVITDGTAVLGLGDIGPLASLPVMEGKSVLFKRFAGLDSFPLALATTEVDAFVEAVALLTPYFGGINLEDISAPRCFEIERKLIERCDIPVFHDDQHGTAVIALAGILNALKVVGKELPAVRAAMVGAGAAGTAICDFLLAAGLGDIVVCDREGAIHPGRPGLNWAKKELAAKTNRAGIKGGLAEACKGADIFLGLSGPGILTAAMIRAMAPKPIILAMANPTPEITPAEALAAGAAVVATGRSDYPNQLNNCLGFPGIFKGALSARASAINGPMKAAAAKALAALVPQSELSPTNIIPTVFDPRVVPSMAEAVAQAARLTGVARI